MRLDGAKILVTGASSGIGAALAPQLAAKGATVGILNAVVLDVRDRVHDIGIQKALGMTPRQTLTTVLSSVVLIGLVGGLVGVPAGVVLHGILLPAMGDGAGVELPQVVLSVFGPWELAMFALGGLVLATAGALLPALVAAEPGDRQKYGEEPRGTRDPALDAAWVRSQGGDALKFLIQVRADRPRAAGTMRHLRRGAIRGSMLSGSGLIREHLRRAAAGLGGPGSGDLITRRSRVRIPPPLLESPPLARRAFGFLATPLAGSDRPAIR